MTLTRRLLLLALISVLPAIAIWTFTEVSLRRAREAEVHDLVIRQARLAGSELERIFDGVDSLLIAVDEAASIRTFDTPACNAYLDSLQTKVPHLLAFVAFDLDGRIRCSNNPPNNPDLRFQNRFYFQEALARRKFVVGDFTSSFIEGGLPKHPVLPLARPIWNDSGGIVGVLVSALDLKWLDLKLKERTPQEDGSVTIADRSGIILAREPFPGKFVGSSLPENAMPYFWVNEVGSVQMVSIDGVKRILGYIPMGEQIDGIFISAGLSTKVAFRNINQAAQRGFMLIAAALILALSLSALTSRAFITKPFEALTDTIRAWRRGDYHVRVHIPGSPGEFGVLSNAFNDLMDDVAKRQQALLASEERARLALDAGKMGTWWYDHEQRAGGWSRQAMQLLGVSDSQSTLNLLEWRQLLHPDDADRVVANMAAAKAGNGEYEDEFRIVRPNGDVRWLNSKGRRFSDPEKGPGYFVGVLQDVTVRREAEDHQRFLLDELNHRVKNTLATVQSIASQTLRSSSSSDHFKEAFEGRLLALSKTHDLLTRNAWRDADLHAIAEQELAPYRRSTDERVVICGPEVNFPARYAINLGMVLHELVTNAAKYGALSAPTGHLELAWTVVHDADGAALLRIRWSETGGPPVTPPKRQGFGSRLLRRSIEGELVGQLTVNYALTGITYDIRVPLPCSGRSTGSEETADDQPASYKVASSALSH